MFRAGDQLVKVGDECLVGLMAEEARNVLDTADGHTEVVVQRKESPRQTLIANTATPMSGMSSIPFQFHSQYGEEQVTFQFCGWCLHAPPGDGQELQPRIGARPKSEDLCYPCVHQKDHLS